MPLFRVALALLSGIALAGMLHLPAAVWMALAFGGGLLWLLSRSRHAPLWLQGWYGGLVLVFALGGLRFTLADMALWQRSAHLTAFHNQGKVQVQGWICALPDQRERVTLLTVCAERLEYPRGTLQPVDGRILVSLMPQRTWEYGQRLELYGELQTPEEGEAFSYRAYLARRGILSTMSYPAAHLLPGRAGSPIMAMLNRLRQQAYVLINRSYPQPEAALVSGILLGLDEDFPPDLERAYQETGTAHIIAISGFNMSLLSATLVTLLGRILPLWPASLLSLLGIGLYALFVGGEAAVLRAALMSGLALFGRLIGRTSSGLNALAFSAALLCLFNPTLPQDVSFQLSVMATLGLILYAGPLQDHLAGALLQRWQAPWVRRLAGWLGEYLLVTLAAQITTLPVLLAHFRRLSLSLLLANPLILPAQPALMILGGLSVIVGLLAPTFGQVLAWLAWPLAAYSNRLVLALSQWSLASITLPPFDLSSVLVYYALLLALTLAWRREILRPLLRSSILVSGLAAATLLAWNLALFRPDGRLHLILFNLPQSQAILLRAPDGHTILIDSAASANALDARLSQYLPVMARHLDAIIVTTPRATYLQGLPLTLQRYPTEALYWAVDKPPTRIREAVSGLNLTQKALSPGSALQIGPGLTLEILPPQDEQPPLLLRYGDLRLLLVGEAWPTSALRDMGRTGEPVDGVILRTPSSPAPAEEAPGLVILMGNPTWPLPRGWLATGLHGTLLLSSDGQTLSLYGER